MIREIEMIVELEHEILSELEIQKILEHENKFEVETILEFEMKHELET
jgi:hypothetical protein